MKNYINNLIFRLSACFSAKSVQFQIITLLCLIQVNNLSSQNASPLLPSTDYKDVSRYGIFLHFNINQHDADFRGSQLPMPSCCPRFTDGSGMGISAGLLYEYPISNGLFIGLRGGYYGLSGTMKSQEKETVYDFVHNSDTTGIFEHTLDASIGLIGIEPMISYRIWRGLYIQGGVNLSLIGITKTYEHKERILEPDGIAFENNLRERLISKSDIANMTSVNISPEIGLSYEISLNKSNSWLFTPEVFYSYMLSDIVNDVDFRWRIHTLRIGASVKYAPSWIAESEKKSILRGDVNAIAVDYTGNESNVVTIKVEEYLSSNLKPLLTYVFFDENSAAIRPRYRQLLQDETAGFSIDKLYDKNALETYYDVLNIIGKRMSEFPEAKIAIDGCNSGIGPEKDNLELSMKRAEAVRDYLHNNWNISLDRMLVDKRNLPQEPSNIRIPDGIEENRRVEITSNKWEIIAPVLAKDTFRLASPPTIRFKPEAAAESGLKSWTLEAGQDGKMLKSFEGYDILPQYIDWKFEIDQKNIPRGTDVLDYALKLNDNQGQSYETKIKSLPVEQVTIQKKRREQQKDKYIDRFSLILFSFDESKLSLFNSKVTDIIKGVVKPGSTIRISGHTDRIGNDDYNLRLSNQRALVVSDYIKAPNTLAQGFGEKELIFDNNTPEGRFYSRRVDVIVETPIEER